MKNLTGKNCLVEDKHILWDEIVTKISKFWNHLVVLQDEQILACHTEHDINKPCNELSDKPLIVDSVITFLNSRSKNDLKEMNINDGIEIIMEASKLHTNMNFIQ